MSAETLEVLIESAWLCLAALPHHESRTIHLTRYVNGAFRLVGMRKLRGDDELRGHRYEIGTYNRAATLQQFREDVFFVFDQMQGRKAA